MNSRELKREIYTMPEFNLLGGVTKGVGFPLLKKKEETFLIVFPVFGSADELPEAFVIREGEHLQYVPFEEGLSILDLQSSDFYSPSDPFRELLQMDPSEMSVSEWAKPARTPDDLPEDMYERFDRAYHDGTPDEKLYHEYLEELRACSSDTAKNYLKAFAL